MKRSVLKVSRLLSVLAVAGMLWLPVQGFGANPDSIVSGDIKEADGTSGQDTNSGSGIKSGHIQSGAITTEKIADGAVANGKLADGAISTSKIGAGAVATGNIANGAVANSKIADGSVTTEKIGTGAITTDKVANDAITDAKISGSISTAKLNVGTTSGTVASGDHNHDALYQKKYAKVVVVAKSGGDFDTIASALSNITDNSASSRYLVMIMPGIYDENIIAKEYVDIAGYNRTTSIIRGFGQENTIYNAILAAPNMSINNLTVETIGGYGYAINIPGNNSVVIDCDVKGYTGIIVTGDYAYINNININANNGMTIDSIDASTNTISAVAINSSQQGLSIGTPDTVGTPLVLNNVHIASAGAGIFINNGHVLFNNVSVKSVWNGIMLMSNQGFTSSVKCISCLVSTTNFAIRSSGRFEIVSSVIEGSVYPNDTVLSNIKIGGTQITGNVNRYFDAISPVKLVNCFDGNYDQFVNGNY